MLLNLQQTHLHHYAFLLLGAVIVVLGLWALMRKRISAAQPLLAPWLLVIAMIMQVILRKANIDIDLSPFTLLVVGLIWWLILATHPQHPPSYLLYPLRPFALLALLFIILQICFHAWLPMDYHLLVCSTVNTCHWQGHFKFNIQTIYQTITLLIIFYFFLLMIIIMAKRKFHTLRSLAFFTLLFLLMQLLFSTWHISLGYQLSSAWLLMAVITLFYKLYGKNWGYRL